MWYTKKWRTKNESEQFHNGWHAFYAVVLRFNKHTFKYDKENWSDISQYELERFASCWDTFHAHCDTLWTDTLKKFRYCWDIPGTDTEGHNWIGVWLEVRVILNWGGFRNFFFFFCGEIRVSQRGIRVSQRGIHVCHGENSGTHNVLQLPLSDSSTNLPNDL